MENPNLVQCPRSNATSLLLFHAAILLGQENMIVYIIIIVLHYILNIQYEFNLLGVWLTTPCSQTMLRLALIFLALAQCLVAEQCAPDKNNPCITSCNGTTFDISKLFHYP